MAREYVYVQAAVGPEIKQQIQEMADAERRSISQQAARLLELGMAEYRRQAVEQSNIESGRSQLNPDFMQAARGKEWG